MSYREIDPINPMGSTGSRYPTPKKKKTYIFYMLKKKTVYRYLVK